MTDKFEKDKPGHLPAEKPGFEKPTQLPVDPEKKAEKEAAEAEKKKEANEKAAVSIKDVVEDAAAKHKAFVDKKEDK